MIRLRTATALAAAGLVLTAGCARPVSTTATAPVPFSSSAPSSSTPAGPAGTAAATTGSTTAGSTPAASPATAPSTAAASGTPDPRESLDPAAAASTMPYPRGRAGVPAGGLPAAALRTSPDPLVVAAAALTVFYGSDTTLDTQPMDAEKRALPWLGGAVATAVASAQIVAAPGAVWNGWAAHRAHLVVTVARGYDDGAPPNTPTASYQQWVVTQTPVGVTRAKRWTGPPVQTVVLVVCTRTGGRWSLTRLSEED